MHVKVLFFMLYEIIIILDNIKKMFRCKKSV